jgi:hypothetical protein
MSRQGLAQGLHQVCPVMTPRHLLVCLTATAALLAAPSPGRADEAPVRILHVDAAGDDLLADGSAALPWRTLQRAADRARPGDVVAVRGGTYAGFDLRQSGREGQPIVFRAEPGVVIDTANPVTPGHGINVAGVSHVVLEAFTIVGLPGSGIRLGGTRDVALRQNSVERCGGPAIAATVSDDLTLEANLVTGSRQGAGILVSSPGGRLLIRNNVARGNRGAGIQVLGAPGVDAADRAAAVIEANHVVDNAGPGIEADGVRGLRLQNNLVHGNRGAGLAVRRATAGGAPALIAHNTVIQAADADRALWLGPGVAGPRIVNNLLLHADPARGGIGVTGDTDGLVDDHNLIAGEPAALFVDAPGGDYRLRDQASARDAGTPLAAVTHDRDGRPRPLGPAPDVGAYEVGSAPATAMLHVVRTGPGRGTVTSAPAGLHCGHDCAEPYPPGTRVTLTATPDPDSAFSGWQEGCEGSGPCVVTVGADTLVVATFTEGRPDPDLRRRPALPAAR